MSSAKKPVGFEWSQGGNEDADQPEKGNVMPADRKRDEKCKEGRVRNERLPNGHREARFLVLGECKVGEEQMVRDQQRHVGGPRTLGQVFRQQVTDEAASQTD